MGIQYLNTYIKKNTTKNAIYKVGLNHFRNKIIAIDTSIYLYRFLADDGLLENMYLMLSLFKYYNITPIFVFDGKPPNQKNDIIEKRNNEKLLAEYKYNELEKKNNYN